MKTSKFIIKLLICLICVTQTVAIAQDRNSTFKPEQLEQLVAPIALYPDSLLSQILMASTYPLEIVQAQRWMQQNSSLKGDALATELEKKSWDPSVKSLTNFPDVLEMMNEKLDWTQRSRGCFSGPAKGCVGCGAEASQKGTG